MDVNAIKEEEESQLLKANTKMNRKKLTNEERAALRLLGLCYFYWGEKHLLANCLEKPPQEQGQDRRALLEKPPVRLPPNKWTGQKVGSTKTEEERIFLTKDYIKQNMKDLLLKLDEDYREALALLARQVDF